MRIRFASILLALILLSSCATPYQYMGFRGGYDDEMLDANTAQVLFAGNSHTSLSTVKTYVLLRCAEVTVKHNFSYFEVETTYSDSLHGVVNLPRPGQASSLTGGKNYLEEVADRPLTLEPIYQNAKHSVSAVINMFKENTSKRGRYRYNARQILAGVVNAGAPLSHAHASTNKNRPGQRMAGINKTKGDDKAVAWADKSYHSVQEGNWVEAIRTASVAISISPDFEPPYINRGYAYQQLKKTDLAANDYRTACELNENAACLNFKSIEGYRPDSVIELLQMSSKKSSENSWQEVVALSTTALKIQPESEVALVNRARAYAELGKLDDALKDCNKAISLNPDYALAYHHRAYVYELMKNADVAILGYEISCELGDAQSCLDATRLKAVSSLHASN